MSDKDVMEGLLLLEKGVCDLYMHGTIESSTGKVHSAFGKALNESLCIQDDIYSQMSAKGWYSPDNAEGTRIDSVKQKFSTDGTGSSGGIGSSGGVCWFLLKSKKCLITAEFYFAVINMENFFWNFRIVLAI